MSGEKTVTEAEWLACTDPQKMLEFLRGKASDRKLRLFACACCRRIWHLLTDKRSRTAVETAEQCADGHFVPHQLPPYYAAASDAADVFSATTTCFAAARAAADAVRSYPSTVEGMLSRAANAAAGAAAGAVPSERPVQAILLRDIIGNPFRPYADKPSRFTIKIMDLAHTIYDSRAFNRLPVLADALEESGCTNNELLGHLRGPGSHVRGCWVVDLCLGKS
jgi:hypothetical protein